MASSQMTVKKLMALCYKEMEKGNGDRILLISDDNEGNGYHGLFFGFTEITEDDKEHFPMYDTQETEPSKILILG